MTTTSALKGTDLLGQHAEPDWDQFHAQELLASHIAIRQMLAKAAPDAPANTTAAPLAAASATPSAGTTTTEDPAHATARAWCGVWLTDENAGFELRTAKDYSTAIDWNAVGDTGAILGEINKWGPLKPNEKGLEKYNLSWRPCTMTVIISATTRGDLATKLAACYS